MKKIYAHLALFTAAFYFLAPQAASAQTRLADSTALVALYSNNGGTGWVKNTNWLTANPIDTWYGVHVSPTGRVDSVSLPWNNLVNACPNTVNAITTLAKFDVSHNNLTGNMPYQSNDSLQILNVSYNQLNGGIFFYALPSLAIMRINNNGFSTGIGSVASYPLIKEINASHNSFTGGLPFFGGNLIDSIDLSDNLLTGSVDYYAYPNCNYYNLSNNHLSGAWIYYSGLSSPAFLDVSHNKFTFKEMEPVFTSLPAKCTYAPQDTVLPLHLNSAILFAAAGGTISNNTYKWYNDGNLQATKTGDSAYHITDTGSYMAAVTSSVVTGLTLTSRAFTAKPITATAIRIIPVSSCGTGSDGSFTIGTAGGIAPYTYYLVKPGSPVATQASNLFTGLSVDTYSAGVVSGAGDTAKLTGIVITKAGAFSATATPSPASACGSPNGKVHATVTGGISPYWYTLTKPGGATVTQEDGPTFYNLTPGTYSISVTDNAGCNATASNIAVTQPPAMQVKALATDAKSCGTGNDGQVNVDRTNGAAPFQYSLAKQGGATITQLTNHLFTGLDSGVYTVSVKDNAGCTDTIAPVTVNFKPISLTTKVTANASCNYNNNENLNIYVTGGAAPYTYALSYDYNNVIFTTQKSSIFSNLNGGTYNIVVTDHNGCGDTIKNFVMPEGPHPSVFDTSVKAPSCITASDGAITAAIKGGRAPYTFYLEDKNYNLLTYAVGDTITFSSLAAGSYIVSASDAKTCGAGYSYFTLPVGAPCGAARSILPEATEQPTGINKGHAGSFAVQALPNPSTTNFTLLVTTDKNDAVELIVFDLYGRAVHHALGAGSGTYSFGQTFAAGVYIARVMQGGEIKTIKLIKQ